jgi:hypothetical protein
MIFKSLTVLSGRKDGAKDRIDDLVYNFGR